MTGFLIPLVVSFGLMVLLMTPTLYLAWRGGKTRTIGRFLIAAGVVGLLIATVAATSGQSLEQCELANGRACRDYGSTGMQLTMVVIFTIVAWIKAFALWNE